MALRATPTIAICLTAGVAAGVALARPGDQQAPAASAPVAEAASAESVVAPEPDNESPYLDDGSQTPTATGTSDAQSPAPAQVGISIADFAFGPAGTVAAGSQVAVTNFDGTDHTLTARDGEFDTGAIGPDALVSFAAPATPGAYEFFCVIHPSMSGSLVVS